MTNVVSSSEMKMTPPERKNVFRTPIMSGNTPPISGPSRLPESEPIESLPSAQAERSRGVWLATRMTLPDV